MEEELYCGFVLDNEPSPEQPLNFEDTDNLSAAELWEEIHAIAIRIGDMGYL